MNHIDGDKTNICGCGCGKETKRARNGKFNRFLVGHNAKHGNANSSTKNHHSGLFKPGNKYGKGRPEGSRNSVTLAAENLIAGEGEALTRKLIELALDGNVACLKTAIERLVPVRKSQPIDLVDMPRVDTIADASKLTAYVLEAMAQGKISPVEGDIISRSCERHLKALEVKDIEQRLSELEKQLISNKSK